MQVEENIRVLRSKPGRSYFMIAGSACFILLGFFLMHTNPLLALVDFCFFGLGFATGLVSLIPSFSYLVLRRKGFEVVYVWRRFCYHWGDVSDIDVVSTCFGARVGWNMNSFNVKKRSFIKNICGRDLFLTDKYGLPPTELCSMMVEMKKSALSE